jgi:hypothetical protein
LAKGNSSLLFRAVFIIPDGNLFRRIWY